MGVRISNLPAIATPAMTDSFAVVQGTVTYKETITQLAGLLAIPTTVGAAGTILRSNATAWVASTSTFADTYAVSTLLYAGSLNAVSGLATTNRAALGTSATGVPQWLALTDGQIVIGSTAGAPAAASITGGTGVNITNGSNSITIDVDSGGLEWFGIAGTTQGAAVDSGYVVQNAGATTITLPAVFDLGSTVAIQGLGAAGWILTASGGDTIQVGSSATSAGGTVTSSNQWDSIVVVAVVANTTWAMQSSVSAGFVIA